MCAVLVINGTDIDMMSILGLLLLLGNLGAAIYGVEVWGVKSSLGEAAESLAQKLSEVFAGDFGSPHQMGLF